MKPTITIIKDKSFLGRAQHIISVNNKEIGAITAQEAQGIKGTAAYSIAWFANWKQKLFPAGEATIIERGDRSTIKALNEAKSIAKQMIIDQLAKNEEPEVVEAPEVVEEAPEAPAAVPTVVELVKMTEEIVEAHDHLTDLLEHNYDIDLYNDTEIDDLIKSQPCLFQSTYNKIQHFNDLVCNRINAQIAFAVEHNILTLDEIENPIYSTKYDDNYADESLIYKKSLHLKGDVFHNTFASLTRYDDADGTRFEMLLGDQIGWLNAHQSRLYIFRDITDDEAEKLLHEYAQVGFKLTVLSKMIKKYIRYTDAWQSSTDEIEAQINANKKEIQALITDMADEYLFSKEEIVYAQIAALSQKNIQLIADYGIMYSHLLTYDQVQEYKAA